MTQHETALGFRHYTAGMEPTHLGVGIVHHDDSSTSKYYNSKECNPQPRPGPTRVEGHVRSKRRLQKGCAWRWRWALVTAVSGKRAGYSKLTCSNSSFPFPPPFAHPSGDYWWVLDRGGKTPLLLYLLCLCACTFVRTWGSFHGSVELRCRPVSVLSGFIPSHSLPSSLLPSVSVAFLVSLSYCIKVGLCYPFTCGNCSHNSVQGRVFVSFTSTWGEGADPKACTL